MKYTNCSKCKKKIVVTYCHDCDSKLCTVCCKETTYPTLQEESDIPF